MTSPHVMFHDQECIDLELFPLTIKAWHCKKGKRYLTGPEFPWFKVHTPVPYQFFNKMILVHSEYNSDTINTLSQHGYIPVHIFSHGFIARDWYRYAEHDPVLQRPKTDVSKKFLIYNRAWSGTREYRLKFSELLVQNNLVDQCKTTFNPVDDGSHYTQHKFKNTDWAITTQLEQYFGPNTYDSTASADYVAEDYRTTAVEIVLETVADRNLVYLTEKSLRPIAARQPFIIVAGAGALKYLRRYGFETFAPWINEDYDDIADHKERMQAVIKEMQRLKALPTNELQKLLAECDQIAKRNQQHFFSNEFTDQLIQEYQTGMDVAVKQCFQDLGRYHWDQTTDFEQSPEEIQKVLQIMGFA